MTFGTNVNPTIIGTNPAIPTNATVRDDLDMQYDYRSVYAAILADWFKAPKNIWTDALLDYYPILPIFRKDDVTVLTERGESPISECYPNPFRDKTCFSFISQGGNVTIALYDAAGRMVKTIVSKDYDAGYHHVYMYRDGLQAGNYVYKFANMGKTAAQKMTIID